MLQLKTVEIPEQREIKLKEYLYEDFLFSQSEKAEHQIIERVLKIFSLEKGKDKKLPLVRVKI